MRFKKNTRMDKGCTTNTQFLGKGFQKVYKNTEFHLFIISKNN